MSTIKADEVTAVSSDGSITITGAGSGVVKLGDGALKFPDADGSAGQFIKTDGSAQLAFAEAGGGGFTLGTEQATTSGTSVTFGSIPAGTTMIVVMLEAVSFTNGARIGVQIGDAGGTETTGYTGCGSSSIGGGTLRTEGLTTQWNLMNDDSSSVCTINVMLSLKDSANFTWIQSHSGALNAVDSCWGGGAKSLTAELTQVTVMGGTLDAGSFNIMYQ